MLNFLNNVREEAPCWLVKRCFKLLSLLNTFLENTQPAFTCSKLTIEILEQGVKYVQS